MQEFIRQNFFYLNEGVIILAALVGLFCLRKFRHSKTRYFIFFLVYVVIIELLGYYPSYGANHKSFRWIEQLTKNTIFEENYLWYTIFWQLGSAVFLTFYFGKVLYVEPYKKIIRYSLIFYIIFAIIHSFINYEIYYNDGIKSIWILSVCQITLCIALYFLEILNNEKIMSFYKSFEFYVASVFFIWLLIKTPLAFYQIYYSTADWNFIFLRRDIILFANMFMYLTFAFAFLWCKPQDELT